MFSWFSFNHVAFASDDQVIKNTFLSLDHFIIEDGDAPWRISLGSSADDALSQKGIIEGISTSRGEVRLSKPQRVKLYSAWQKAPNQLWLLFYGQAFHVTPVKVADLYEIQFIQAESEVSRKLREADEKQNIARNTPLAPSTFTQAHFNASPFIADYKNWQQRFKQDIATFEASMKNNHAFGRKLFAESNTEALKHSFGQSIDIGHKGLSLRESLISAYYAPAGHEGTEVTPTGYVITQLLMSEDAKPVGYGGTFIDEGNTVELWYMVFDDMTKWTMQDLNESFNFKAFTPVELPPYKTIRRNHWPAVVFVRDATGQLKMYALSIELASIVNTIYNAQLF